jgi:hypothetical protein
VSTIILLGLIVAYHALEVQVSKWTLNLFVCLMVYITSVQEHAVEKASEAFLWRNWRVRFQMQQQLTVHTTSTNVQRRWIKFDFFCFQVVLEKDTCAASWLSIKNYDGV